jgi:ArsR family transcriptional regulator
MRILVKTFKALSDPNRIRILKMLQIRSLCVCEITEVLNLATSTVSKHLSILRDANLILDEKDGKWVNYEINRSGSEMYSKDLMPLLEKWLPEDQLVLLDAEKVSQVDRNVLCNGG